jgi:hypothetical protein
LFYGILDNGAASANAVTISNNTIGTASANNINITSSINTASSTLGHYGIFLDGAGTNVTASSNTIRNITSSGTTGASGIRIVGLGLYTGTKVITGNTISSIKYSNTTAGIISVYGMYFNGATTVTATKNSILDLVNQTTRNTSLSQEINGVVLSGSSQTANLYNNLIKITNSSNTNGIKINGVSTNAGTLNLLHNTIVIGGAETETANSASNTACFRYESSCPTLSAKNNIFNFLRQEISSGRVEI